MHNYSYELIEKTNLSNHIRVSLNKVHSFIHSWINYLVVHVGEELDDHGEEVLRDHVQVGGLHLLAVHGDVGHLERIGRDIEASDTAAIRLSCRG